MNGLPRQWKHWCEKTGLRPTAEPRRKTSWLYLKGRGRLWRVNNRGMFQVSCPEQDFDRWANSLESETTMPTCLEEMKAAVSVE